MLLDTFFSVNILNSFPVFCILLVKAVINKSYARMKLSLFLALGMVGLTFVKPTIQKIIRLCLSRFVIVSSLFLVEKKNALLQMYTEVQLFSTLLFNLWLEEKFCNPFALRNC